MAGRHRKPPARGRHRKPPRRGHVVVPAVAAVAVLGVGGVSAAATLFGGSGGNGVVGTAPTPRVMPRATAPSATPSTPTSPSSTSPAAPAPAPAGARPLPDFAITVTGRVSWVEVVGPHGRVLYLGMLRHGHSLSFRQRPLAVTLGDAGAVRLVLHHHARARAGRPGEVLTFTVS